MPKILTMNKKHLLLVFVLCLIGGLFCACHKEEIKEPTDYRDKWVVEYSCLYDPHTGAAPWQIFIRVEKVKSLDSALYFYCYGGIDAKFVSSVDFYGNFSSYTRYFGSFYAEDSIVVVRHIDFSTFSDEIKFHGKKIK